MPRYEDGRLFISNNSLGSIARCDTMAIANFLGFGSIEERAELLSGSAGHTANEVYFKTWNKIKALNAFKREYQPWSRQFLRMQDRLAYENVVRVLGRYYDEHPPHVFPFKVDPDLLERSFDYPLTDRLVISGRPDAIVYESITNKPRLGVVDHKFTKTVNEWFRLRYEMDTQPDTYWWVAQKTLGLQVMRFYINASELPQLNSSPKTCPRHKKPYYECAILHPKFHQFTYIRTPEMIETWRRNAIRLGNRMLHLIEKVPDISKIERADMRGRFNGSCNFCGKRSWCQQGRPVRTIENFLQPGESLAA